MVWLALDLGLFICCVLLWVFMGLVGWLWLAVIGCFLLFDFVFLVITLILGVVWFVGGCVVDWCLGGVCGG